MMNSTNRIRKSSGEPQEKSRPGRETVRVLGWVFSNNPLTITTIQ